MNQKRGVLIGVVVLAILFAVSWYIYVPVKTAMDKPIPAKIADNIKPAAEQKTDQGEQAPSTGGQVFSFILLGLALVGVIVATCIENPWPKFLLQPVFIAIVVIAVFCALMNLFIYSAWQWIWNHQLLFWGTSLTIPLYAYSWSRKEPWIKFAARSLIFIVLCGFVWNGIGNAWKKSEIESSNTTSKVATDLSYNDAPTDIAFPIIAKYESRGKQFQEDKNGNIMKDKDGNPIVYRGENKHDIGYLQINEVIHAPLIKEHPELNIYKSKEDNIKMGEIIKEKYHGYGPWYLSESRWGPELAAKGFGGVQVTTLVPIEAPIGIFGEKIIVRPGFDVRWGESEDAFTIVNDKGLSAKYDRANGILENLSPPSQWLKFRSLSDKTAVAKLRFSRIK